MSDLKVIKLKAKIITKDYLDFLYKDLLKRKGSYCLIKYNKKNYILTKEQSLFKVDNYEEFINKSLKDQYYKTIIIDSKINVPTKDLELFNYYIKKYHNKMNFNGEYLFGSIAVKIDDHSFITTIRGKKDLKDYTTISIDHDKGLVMAYPYKATLNAPLIARMFENKNVKAVIHYHNTIPNLPIYPYAFPGTIRDSNRNNKTYFNIKNHGVIILLDKDKNIIKEDL